MTAGDSNFSDIPAEEETQIEETTFKDYPESSKQRPWWTIMLMGMVLGIGITMGGMHLLNNRPKDQPKVANLSTTEVTPAMTVTLALVETD